MRSNAPPMAWLTPAQRGDFDFDQLRRPSGDISTAGSARECALAQSSAHACKRSLSARGFRPHRRRLGTSPSARTLFRHDHASNGARADTAARPLDTARPAAGSGAGRRSAAAAGPHARSTQSDAAAANVMKRHHGPKQTPEPPRDEEREQPPDGGRPSDDPEPPVNRPPRKEPPSDQPAVEEPGRPKPRKIA